MKVGSFVKEVRKPLNINPILFLGLVGGGVLLICGIMFNIIVIPHYSKVYKEQFNWHHIQAELSYIDSERRMVSYHDEIRNETIYIGHYIGFVGSTPVELTYERGSKRQLKDIQDFYVNPNNYHNYHVPVKDSDLKFYKLLFNGMIIVGIIFLISGLASIPWWRRRKRVKL